MKKTRIFLAAGTLVLAISAIFATKANKKFAQVLTGTANGDYTFQVPSNVLLTTINGGSATRPVYVQLVTGNSTHFKIGESSQLETIHTNHPIFYK